MMTQILVANTLLALQMSIMLLAAATFLARSANNLRRKPLEAELVKSLDRIVKSLMFVGRGLIVGALFADAIFYFFL